MTVDAVTAPVQKKEQGLSFSLTKLFRSAPSSGHSIYLGFALLMASMLMASIRGKDIAAVS
jgi:hypothetical protein